METKELIIEARHIKNAVAKYFHCRPSRLDLRLRHRNVVIPRQVAHYLATKYKSGSKREIGEVIGMVDHASVIHSVKCINNLIDTGWYYKGVRIDRIVKECEILALNQKAIAEEKSNKIEVMCNECEFLMC